MLAAERNRITAAMADLAAARDARDALDHMIDIAQNPTPEHCPALRDPDWAPYEALAPTAQGTRVLVMRVGRRRGRSRGRRTPRR